MPLFIHTWPHAHATHSKEPPIGAYIPDNQADPVQSNMMVLARVQSNRMVLARVQSNKMVLAEQQQTAKS